MAPPPAEHLAARIFLGPALRAQSDHRLVDLVRNGYDAAFEEIVRRYRRPLDRFAAALVGGHSEDVTQDAFSKALLALRGSEAEIELRPWLYRIVRNTALNDLRDRPPAAAELAETLPGGRSAAAEAEAREELQDLMGRLRALPEPQRAALVMRELEGLSHEEIAAALGVSGGAARQAIFRARAALRDGLGLLMPMPVLRALAGHGDEAARAGGAIAAGAGGSAAGGAALGGLGGGAVKIGLATVLVAGTVGAGAAIDRHHGERGGPEAAAAAPLTRQVGGRESNGVSGTSADDTPSRSPDRGGGDGADDDRGHGGSGDDSPSLDNGRDSGSSGSPHHTGDDSSGGGHGGPGPSSGSIESSGSGSRHGGDRDGGGDRSGSGSGDVGSDDHGGSSGGSGGSDDPVGVEDHSGPGGGDGVVTEPIPTTEPKTDGGSGSGSGSGSDGGGSGSGSGSGDLSGGATSGLDESS